MPRPNLKAFHQSCSIGAHRTHRPLALPEAALSAMFGCEHVTACTADILRSVIEYNVGKGLNLNTGTFDDLIIVQGLLPF